MTTLFFDIESPHKRYAVGHIKVENGKVTEASNAYRWMVGFFMEEVKTICFQKGYHLATRYRQVAKNLGSTPGTYKTPNPATRELLRRIAP